MQRLWELADRQHGCASVAQLRSLGFDWHAADRLVQRGTAERLSPRVVRMRGTPMTDATQFVAATLDAGPGSAISHLSAAALWGVPGFGTEVEPTVSRQFDGSRRPQHIGRLIRVRHLPPGHITAVSAIPVLTLPATLYRLAGLVGWERFERAADTVCGRSAGTLAALHEMLPEMAARGRNGITAMRQFLLERPVGHQGTHSSLEARLAQILRDAGEPPLTSQVDLGGHSWIGRVDFFDRLVGLIVEVHSDRFHTTPLAKASDAAREAALREAGFTLVVVWESDVWTRPWKVLEAVRDGRRVALRRLDRPA